MKSLILFFLLVLCLNSQASLEDEQALAALNEGIPGEIPQTQIEEVLAWAKTSKFVLENLLMATQELPKDKKLAQLIEGINAVVVKSAPKNSELYLRYILNRARLVQETIEKVSAAEDWVSLDARINLLEQSIDLAINRYYVHDLELLKDEKQRNKVPSPAEFGLAYASFLANWAKSIMNPRGQHQVYRLIVTFLRWDLMRDGQKAAYSEQIAILNATMLTLPVAASEETPFMHIRMMKKNIHSALGKSQHIAKTFEQRIQEEKRQAALQKEEADRLADLIQERKALEEQRTKQILEARLAFEKKEVIWRKERDAALLKFHDIPGAPKETSSMRILSATYGKNAGAKKGNATLHMAQACDGKSLCHYQVLSAKLGDPAPGVAKDFFVQYSCLADDRVRNAKQYVGDEGRTITIDCQSQDREKLIIHSASYSSLENPSRDDQGNLTHYLKKECKGQFNCETSLNFNVIEDPAPFQHKALEAYYQCGENDKMRMISIPMAGPDTFIYFHCPNAKDSLGTIQIISGSMGVNKIPSIVGNATYQLASRCQGQTACVYRFDNSHMVADPAPFQEKDFLATYYCEGEDQIHFAHLEANAHGREFLLTCPYKKLD